MTVFLSAPSLLSNDSMRGFQQRFVQRGLQVSGYRNLNKQGYFSLLSREGVDKGRVICHAPAFHLRSGKQPAIKISSASQQRAQR
ncbi:hypothetical protein [Motilimonas eburnea]|uniref:hypothetical protein n=1 Tax=Motilimonas eburnea TaxID=1737488 RepID=UPI001E3FDBCF|nr:hypothetical protein [Motilimonas eburnea]MCE2571758.1 hypothetical protein [Motilimonas eburnea]